MALALRACAAALKRHGIEVSIPFRELMGFRNYWIEQGMSYSWQARRSYIQQLFEPAIDVLFRLDDARLEAVTATSCSPPSPLQPLLCGERTRPGPKDPARRAVVPLGHYVTQHPGKSVTPRAGEFRDAIILRKKGSGIKPGTVHGDGEGDEWWFAERAPEPAACYLSFRPWPVNRWGDGPHQPRPSALLDQGPLNLISANDLEPPFTPAFPRTHRARGPDGRPRIRCGTLLFKCLYPW